MEHNTPIIPSTMGDVVSLVPKGLVLGEENEGGWGEANVLFWDLAGLKDISAVGEVKRVLP